MKDNVRIKDLTKMALCVAILCITSYMIIPLPFTPIVIGLQTIMINLIALLFRPKEAGMTILIYLLMGLIGLPVFSGGTSGPGKLFGPTGGFYFGFLLSVILISWLKGNRNSFKRYSVITILVGIPVQHLLAVVWMSVQSEINMEAAFITVSLPFIVGDILKCVIASSLGVALRKRL
jgi:biotin transport system substrate-specific component